MKVPPDFVVPVVVPGARRRRARAVEGPSDSETSSFVLTTLGTFLVLLQPVSGPSWNSVVIVV